MSREGAYTLTDGVVDAETLLAVREAAGLSVYPLEQAKRGVANSIFGVGVHQGEKVIGIGRIIGDGGFFYDIVDIAVLPEHQGRGIGKMIMKRLVDYVVEELPPRIFVSLHADKGATGLYEKFGFRSRGADQPGMAFNRELL